ncbi:MAG: FmdE family protein [Candidatus Bathyarchaeaceae archaeon]
MLKQSMDTELMSLLNKAADFHGHLGPFLVLGVRMGLIGVRELEAKENDKELRVTVMSKYSVPFSCVIDGIQVTTKCTVGNKKLRVKNSSGITAKFELQNRQYVSVAVNSVAFNKLRNDLPENSSNEELQELAKLVVSMPEEELFIVERG